MRVADLEIYGIPKVLIENWRIKIGEELLPLQEAAIRENLLMDDDNLIISAPTSSGKTFCGEMVMAKTLAAGQKCICLVPLKALAEERFRDFDHKYKPLGLKTIIASGDRREYDRQLEKGDFNLAIIVLEKFNQLLTRNLDILSSVKLILVDELQMIGDSSRGSVLELALLKLKQSKYKCRLIGLSAVLSNANGLAEWLGAKLLTSTFRPLDLLQGVMWEGQYFYKKHNSGEKGQIEILKDRSLTPDEQLLGSIEKLAGEGERVLVFLKSKLSCQEFAGHLAQRLSFTSAVATQEKLRSIPGTSLTEILLELLEKGVAFHHADLSFEQRAAIEEGYKNGEIRVLFATTTLSLGLNLPVNTVFLEPVKFTAGCYTNRLLPQPLDWSEYENMCGRAGRLNYVTGAGKAIMLVNSEFEKEVVWSKFMDGKPPELHGHLGARDLKDLVLDLIVAGCCVSNEELETALNTTFSRAGFSTEEIGESILSHLERRWIERREKNLMPTALGKSISSHGICTRTAERFLTLLQGQFVDQEIFWIYEFLDSFEMTSRGGWICRGQYESEQMQEICLSGKQSESLKLFRLAEVISEPQLLDQNAKSKMIQALAMRAWCDGEGIFEIERKFHISAGSVANMTEILAWLSDSVAALAATLRLPRGTRIFFKQLAFSLERGISPELRPLWKLLGGLVDREGLHNLYQRGIRNDADLKQLSRNELDSLIGADKAENIIKRVYSEKIEGKEQEMSSNGHKLVLEGKLQRDRLTVRFQGRELPLTLKSFKYLAKLACAKLCDRHGWLHKDKLEPGFNQARYIYNLKRELGLSDNFGLLENNREGYYRLNLEPKDIGFNLENLKSIPDHEITVLVDQVELSKFAS